MKRLSICSFAMTDILRIAADAAAATDLNITAFYRKVQGGGITENDDSIHFGVTARDFDFTIGPAGNGFSVEWTSVISGGEKGLSGERQAGQGRALVRRFMRPAGSYQTRRPVPPSPRPVTAVSIPC